MIGMGDQPGGGIEIRSLVPIGADDPAGKLFVYERESMGRGTVWIESAPRVIQAALHCDRSTEPGDKR